MTMVFSLAYLVDFENKLGIFKALIIISLYSYKKISRLKVLTGINVDLLKGLRTKNHI